MSEQHRYAKKAFKNRVDCFVKKIKSLTEKASKATTASEQETLRQQLEALEAKKQAFVSKKDQFLSLSIEELEAARTSRKEIQAEYTKKRGKLRAAISWSKKQGKFKEAQQVAKELSELTFDSFAETMNNGTTDRALHDGTLATSGRHGNRIAIPQLATRTAGMVVNTDEAKYRALETFVQTQLARAEEAKKRAAAKELSDKMHAESTKLLAQLLLENTTEGSNVAELTEQLLQKYSDMKADMENASPNSW